MHYPPLRERVIALLVNMVIAFCVLFCSSGSLLPSGGLEAVWFMSALSLWFLSLLSAPWFVPPRDAVVSSIGAILVLATMEFSSVNTFQSELTMLRTVAIFFSVAVLLLAFVAIVLHDKDERSPPGRLAYKLVSEFAKGEILFSAPAIVSIVAYYQATPTVMVWLILYWLLIVVVKPVELGLAVARKFSDEEKAFKEQPTVGTVVRVDHPDIVRVRLSLASAWGANKLFAASLPDESQRYVLSLFAQTQGNEVVGTGLCVGALNDPLNLPTSYVCAAQNEEKAQQFLEDLSGSKDAVLVGFVVEGSSIEAVRFELSSRSGLQEGDVVYARIKDKDIFYQIVGAETYEESFDQNPRGTHIVKAAQLGIYTAERGFEKYSWLPAMNTPLFAASSREFEAPKLGDREFIIGDVPSTNVGAVVDLDDLVEYHTAILGVTGTGKTEVALEAVRNAVERGVKVFCVDFTGDYRARLADLDPIFPAPETKQAKAMEGLLAMIDAYGFKAGDEKKRLKEISDNIRKETEATIDDFLTKEKSLAIFELAEISNSKTGLRLTEIFLSAIMNWAKEHRGEQKVLICLEEAHTIVPEAFGSGFDGETKWVVERIGQIALQGRKYGVGLMVITQRTALVSKTILSQCNTFLTHSLIDQTSLNFLESVYSSQHSRLIPNLERYHFIAFGKALKSERPIVLRREFDQKKLDASLAVRSAQQEKANQENATAQVEESSGNPEAKPAE